MAAERRTPLRSGRRPAAGDSERLDSERAEDAARASLRFKRQLLREKRVSELTQPGSEVFVCFCMFSVFFEEIFFISSFRTS